METPAAGSPIGGSGDITTFLIAGHIVAWVSFATACWKGGHVERLGAMVLAGDYLLVEAIYRSPIPHPYMIATVVQFLATLIFIWMAFRFDRWWLFAGASALVLCDLVTLLEFGLPELTRHAAVSAEVGLWLVVYTALLAGAGERWLAGEPAIGDSKPWRSRRASRAGGRR